MTPRGSSGRKRAGQGRHVSELLGELLRSRDLDHKLRLRWAQTAWERACGTEVARWSRPEKFVGDKVVIGVSSSVWLQELSLRKTELLAALREHMPPEMAPSEIQLILRSGGP